MKLSTWTFGLASMLLAGQAYAGHPGSTAAHLHDDVVRNGRADIVFQGGTALAYWSVASNGAVSSSYAGDGGAGYRVVAVSDFDGDGSADVMWTNGSHLKLWVNDGNGGYTPASVGNYGGGWEPFAAGDIDGDGKSDLFFRGATHLAYWLMEGPKVVASSYAGDGGAGWRVVAINRFFARKSSVPASEPYSVDVLWTNGSQFKFWQGLATSRSFRLVPPNSLIPGYAVGWEPFGAGDVNGDGFADILFRAGTHVAYWLIKDSASNGTFQFATSFYGGDAGSGFRPVAASDYDGNGTVDILFDNGSTLKAWHYTSDVGFTPRVIGTYGNGWRPLDMLLRTTP